MWIVDRLDEETESALKLLDDSLNEGGESEVGVLGVDVQGKLRDGLGVSLRLELVALALEQRLQLLVVCDDTVVDDSKFPVGVGPSDDESAPLSKPKSRLQDMGEHPRHRLLRCGHQLTHTV
jgi:hypothetical protein